MRTAYDSVQPMSIDYAVMEKAAAVGNVVMGAMDVGWSDLGTWSALVDRLAGGYEGGARVVPPGEPVALASDDVCVLREATSGVLGFEPGPLHAVASDEPIAFLPAARQHTKVIRDLIERTNSWERQVRVAAMAPHGVAS